MERGGDGQPVEPELPIEDGAGPVTGARDVAGLVIAVALFGLAALIFGDATSYPSRRSYAQFGPEIFPYMVATGVAILAAFTVRMALRGDFEARGALNLGSLLWVLAALVAQIVLLYAGAGFILASAALFGLSARGFGQRPLAGALAVGAAVAAILYALFRYGLGLSLPAGPVEAALDALLR
jgi:putative tricarboxylic transport membrane protein